ncbi:MAG: diguanylate cyclase [Methylococcales bacterium]|nr:diguanylate cyclase [Methylococcales bacterium]
MRKKQQNSWQLDRRLRERAEAKLASLQLTDSERQRLMQSSDELLHELQVHQIELEIQNEELRRLQLELEESRDRYIDLYEFAPIGYLTLSEKGLIAEINLMGSTLFGLERNKLIRRRFASFIVPEDRDRWHHHFLYSKQQSDKQTIELRLQRADNTHFYARLDCLAVEMFNAPPMLRIALSDITNIKIAEQQLRIAATVFESQEGMFITDNQSVILRVNQTFTQITGYTAEEAIGKTPKILKSCHHDAAFYQTMWNSILHTGTWKGEIWNRRKNGEIYPAYLIITAVQDNNGLISHYVATFDDITAIKQAADEIEHYAFYDPLTDLPNRRQLLTRLNQALASSTRHDKVGAVLFIDLDNFKILNDTHGHHQGDLLLKQVARYLIDCTREDDTVARLGGDEFVVVLENLSTDMEAATTEARTVGEKILVTLNQTYSLYDCEHDSSSSIGVVLFNGNQNSAEKLLRQADIAMYQAKMNGRNTLCFFDPTM